MKLKQVCDVIESLLPAIVTSSRSHHTQRALVKARVLSGRKQMTKKDVAVLLYVFLSSPYKRYNKIIEWVESNRDLLDIKENDIWPVSFLYALLSNANLIDSIQELVFENSGTIICRYSNNTMKLYRPSFTRTNELEAGRIARIVPGAVLSRIFSQVKILLK